jgi:hypothetical protein
MHSQSQIKRTLSTPVAVAYVAGLLDSGEFIHRSELADFVCEQCGFTMRAATHSATAV